MSTTISAVAGTNSSGLGNERHVVYCVNSQQWWAFAYTSILTLASWYSNDGSSWTAGATHLLSNAHRSEGRNLAVAYKNISGIDVVEIAIVVSDGLTGISNNAIRATVTANTLTFHSSETVVQGNNTDGDSLWWTGSGLEFDSNNKIHYTGWTGVSSGDTNSADSTADLGTSEQMTPVTWTNVTIDGSMAHSERSSMVFDLGSGKAGLIADNGDSATGTLGLSWFTWSGSAWSGGIANLDVTGSIASIDKNDWGAVAISPTDIHVVYRNSSGTLIHRRYNGSNWINGQTIPAQGNSSGTGIALGTDGASVWLGVIDSASTKAIRYIRWTSLAYNDVVDQWETWGDAEGSTATRTFLGCAKTVASQKLLFYWAESTNLVAVAASAVSPPDPPGIITRDAISALGSATSATSFAIAWTGTQPTSGDKIGIVFWAFFTTTPTISSVKDNATVQNTFTAGPSSIIANTQGVWIYWLDLPIGATWSGNYTVTVTFSASVNEEDGGGIAYGNVQSGPPIATNNNTGSGTSATTGAVNSPSGNSLYLAGITDATGANPATFTWSAPFTARINQLNGSAQQAGSIADIINQSGSENATITLDSSVSWNAAIATWPGAPSQLTLPQINPGQIWRRRFWARRAHPQPLTAVASSGPVSNTVTATDSLAALSDTATELLSLPRSLTDSLAAMSDTATRILGLPRSLSDNLSGLTESAVRVLNLPRTIVDNLSGVTDTATKTLQSFIRTSVDNLVAMSDTLTRILTMPRTLSDSLSAPSETILRVLSLPRTVVDNLSALSDTATRAAISYLRSASDSLSSPSETLSRILSLPRTVIDNLSALSETAIALKVILRTAVDNLSALSDTAARAAIGFTRTATDTLGAGSDTATRILGLSRTIADTLSALSDTVTRAAQSLSRTATDNLAAMSDTATRILSLIRTATDNLNALSETATKSAQSFPRTATDNLVAMSDTATAIKVIARTATDNLAALSDTATRAAQSFLRNPVDSLGGLSETASRVVSSARVAADSLSSVSESVIRLLTTPRLITDNLPALTDAANRVVAVQRSVSDALSALSDSATRATQTFLRTSIDNLAGLVDNVINTGSIPLFFATAKSFLRDGSLMTKIRDGTLKVFNRDASSKNKTRG